MTTRTLSPQQRAVALAALRSLKRHRAGIRAKGAAEGRDSVAFTVDPFANLNAEIDSALSGALSYWPNADTFELIGSDLAIFGSQSQVPPGACILRDPDIAGEFSVSLTPL